jgi:hypothetical protein
MNDLSQFRNLRILALFACKDLTDDGIKQLAALKNLRYLDLLATKISDNGLMELSALPRLEHLRVYSPNLSDAGEKAFQQRHPKCKMSGPTWREAIKEDAIRRSKGKEPGANGGE